MWVVLLSAMPLAAQNSRAELPDAPSRTRSNYPAQATEAWIGNGSQKVKMGLPESEAKDKIERESPPEQIYPVVTLREYPNSPSHFYRPMSRHEKFEYFKDGAKSGYTFVSAAITAGSWHAYGDPPYGTGWDGFGKSYGAALGQRELSMFLQRYAMPVMFREDPRYFAAPTTDSVFRRGMYAASRLVLTQADTGRQKVNCSYLLGGLTSALVGNAYIRQRDSGSVAQDFFIGMGTDAAYNIAREFWPDMRDKFPSRALRRLGDMIIGPHGLPNPEKP